MATLNHTVMAPRTAAQRLYSELASLEARIRVRMLSISAPALDTCTPTVGSLADAVRHMESALQLLHVVQARQMRLQPPAGLQSPPGGGAVMSARKALPPASADKVVAVLEAVLLLHEALKERHGDGLQWDQLQVIFAGDRTERFLMLDSIAHHQGGAVDPTHVKAAATAVQIALDEIAS